MGAILVRRQEALPFTDKQIELVQNFAAQAVIAIENTRLLNELRQSLEQQTATADVLRVISSSPGDLEPVFQAMLDNATRICEAKFGNLYRFDGKAFHFAAEVGSPPELAEFQRRRGPFQPLPGSRLDRVMRTKQVSYAADDAAEAVPGPAVRLGGARSMIVVPMLKDDELIGAITIYRQEVRPFTDKQVELVQNFAAQAVIAIENTRLLNELRQRTDDLSEALEQQTATSEVLSVISSSPGELEPVFQAMLENATRICEGKFGTLFLCEEDAFRVVAQNLPPALSELRQRERVVRPGSWSSLVRSSRTKQVVQIADLRTDKGYLEGDPLRVALIEVGGIRSVLSVPMLKDNTVVGVFNVYREKPEFFSDKQVELVQDFAAQAVIAIENTRLLSELRQRTNDLTESLEQQTAIGEILRVISNSPSDVQPVLELCRQTRCPHLRGAICRYLHPRRQYVPKPRLVRRACAAFHSGIVAIGSLFGHGTLRSRPAAGSRRGYAKRGFRIRARPTIGNPARASNYSRGAFDSRRSRAGLHHSPTHRSATLRA